MGAGLATGCAAARAARLRLRGRRAWDATCSTSSHRGIGGGSVDFLAGPGAAHIYMVHVGAGWAWRSSAAGSIGPWPGSTLCSAGWRSTATGSITATFDGRRLWTGIESPAPRRIRAAGLRSGAGPEPLVRRGRRGRSDRGDHRAVPDVATRRPLERGRAGVCLCRRGRCRNHRRAGAIWPARSVRMWPRGWPSPPSRGSGPATRPRTPSWPAGSSAASAPRRPPA